MTLSVQPNGNYDNIVGIREYKSHFVTVGGLNAPKRIECVGTDGISRRQLVKVSNQLHSRKFVCSVSLSNHFINIKYYFRDKMI